jgi:hypothetical protein
MPDRWAGDGQSGFEIQIYNQRMSEKNSRIAPSIFEQY